MWIVSKEGLLVMGIVAALGIIGIILLLQPARPQVVTSPSSQPAEASQPVAQPVPAPVAAAESVVREVAAPVTAIDGVIYAGEYAHNTEAAGFEVDWSSDATLLRVGLISPGTGWLAVGFDPVNRMQGANFILGAVRDGKTVVRDDFGTGAVGHSPDTANGGSDDILAAAGCEANGKTYLEFIIPLDSGDAMDRPLHPGSTYKILIAYHDSSDDFGTWHTRRGSGSITLDPAP
jgi:hypothetical protein